MLFGILLSIAMILVAGTYYILWGLRRETRGFLNKARFDEV